MGAAGGTRTALADRKAKAVEDKQNQAGAPEQNEAATQEQDPLQTAADAADHSSVGAIRWRRQMGFSSMLLA
ncbi:hypothetical protein PCI56_00830 [Plesiomonas shigelloides subsp. oncorhynchi]|nr:hypothetical protein [Plesiomonas shigelloides]